MKNSKNNNFVLKRLKNLKSQKNKWETNFKKLNEKIDNNASTDKNEQKEILNDLKILIEESTKEYLKSKNIKNLDDDIQLPTDGEEYKELENDLMFELTNNYPINLDDLGIENSWNILNLGINPGDTQKKRQNTNSNYEKVDVKMDLYSFDLDKDMYEKIDPILRNYGIKEKYIWSKYYNPNFEIFKCIEAKYPWVALNRNDFEDEIRMILDAQIKCLPQKEKKLQKNKEKDIKLFMEMYDKEREEFNKNTPLVFFNDLFWIADSNQNELLSILNQNKEKMQKIAKKMINLYIEKYKIGLIVVANAKASEYVKLAVEDNDENGSVFIYKYGKKEIPIIYSGYLAYIDRFSKTRLKKEIKEIYEEKNIF